MSKNPKHVVIVGGGTAGSVLAARLTEDPTVNVTLLEAGPDDSSYDAAVLEPTQAPNAWLGGPNIEMTVMASKPADILMLQGRMLGGTSAVNGMATLRGMPADYDGWAASGLEGWGWADVESTFIAAERDLDFGDSPIHGNSGPLPVRRWRRDEISRGQLAYYDGMLELGTPAVADINDPSQLPGVGVFPVTIDADGRRVTTSLAYLTPAVRARDNLSIKTGAEVSRLVIDAGRVVGVLLGTGETMEADEGRRHSRRFVVTASVNAIWHWAGRPSYRARNCGACRPACRRNNERSSGTRNSLWT